MGVVSTYTTLMLEIKKCIFFCHLLKFTPSNLSSLEKFEAMCFIAAAIDYHKIVYFDCRRLYCLVGYFSCCAKSAVRCLFESAAVCSRSSPYLCAMHVPDLSVDVCLICSSFISVQISLLSSVCLRLFDFQSFLVKLSM
ncbi:hypothetical protein Tco_1474263 [Tanacetum coccineum]